MFWLKVKLNLSKLLERQRFFVTGWSFYAKIRKPVTLNTQTHSHKHTNDYWQLHILSWQFCPWRPHILALYYSLLAPLGHIQMMTLSLLQQPTFELMAFYSQPHSCKGAGGLGVWQEISPGIVLCQRTSVETAPWLLHGGGGGRFLKLQRAAWGEYEIQWQNFLLRIYSLFCVHSSSLHILKFLHLPS